MALEILKYVAAVATILTGAASLFWPTRVLGFTGLDVVGGRGVTEIRSILGGIFIGLGVAVIFINEPAAYQTLGIAYLGAAVIRTISMFVDKSVIRSNVISAVAEAVLGVILIL
jgi:hypothetical protein